MISKIKNNKSGFTLPEILASVAVLVVIGSIASGIITSVLRGAGKVNNTEDIRQIGNYALAQISRNIGYAGVFNGLKTQATSYTTNCPSPATTSYDYIKVTLNDKSVMEYKCISTASPPIFTVNGVDVFDTVNSVDLKSCSLTCTRNNDSDVPMIKINFTLAPKNSSTDVEKSKSISFSSSVTIRNFEK
jgi:prepilin-type N-terminal cleavage/methylation domain-containing protein